MDAEYLRGLAWLPKAPQNFRDELKRAIEEESGVALVHLANHALGEAQLTQLANALIRARAHGRRRPKLTPLRLALLSNATTAHLTAPVIASALRYAIELEILPISYEDAAIAAVVADDARLARFAPDAVLLAIDHRGVPLASEADALAHLRALHEGVSQKVVTACIAQSIARPPSALFGHADRTIAGTHARIIDDANRWLATHATLLDVAALAETIGTASWFDARLWHFGKFPFAMQYVPLYADHVARLLGALRGKSRRVLVTDLDNTLWGGIVGDDGVENLVIGNNSPEGEARLELQKKLAALRSRGILLAVASKNDALEARRPFREIPDMILKEDSFSAFLANWDDKATNIQKIALELGLGLESFVFLDDNPAERALVRRFLPDVAVLELPEDPSDYTAALDAAGYFEAISFSEEDARRADSYRNKKALETVAPHDLTDYLASLEMELIVDQIRPSNWARAAQLINKSNQFNLTTRRYLEAELEQLREPAFTFRLKDKLDDHGIISVIICEQSGTDLELVSWVMSCRVIGRRVERAALEFLISAAKERGCERLRGRYLPTERNRLVENHYANLGFQKESEGRDGSTAWVLPLAPVELGRPPLRIVDLTRPSA